MSQHPAVPINPYSPTSSLPFLGLGTADGTSPASIKSAVLHTLQHTNIRLIDTAQNYNSEQSVGEAVREFKASNTNLSEMEVWLSCKIDLVSREREDPVTRVLRQVKASLSNLNVTTLTSVIIHWPILLDRVSDSDEERKEVLKETYQTLESLVHSKKITYIGCSNFSIPSLIDILTFCKIRPELNQIECNPYVYDLGLINFCKINSIGVVGYSPFGGCWLARYYPRFVPWKDESLIRHAVVCEIAKELSVTPASVLLKWVVDKCVTPIPKSENFEHISGFSDAFDAGKELTGEQVGRLDLLRDCRRGVEKSIQAFQEIIKSGEHHVN